MNGRVETILFSKTDALGDQLLATGVVSTLIERYPEARIVWLLRQGNETIHTLLPGSRVFTPDAQAAPRAEGERWRQPGATTPGWGRVTFIAVPFNAYQETSTREEFGAEVLWWRKFVAALGCDLAIAGTISLNWVDRAMVWATGAPVRIGCDSLPEAQPLPPTVARALHRESEAAAPTFTVTIQVSPGSHESDSLAALCQPILGCPGRAHIHLPDTSWLPPSALPEAIVIAPGARDNGRIYPLDRVAACVAELEQLRPGATIVILCGPLDRGPVRELQAHLARLRVAASVFEAPASDLAPAAALLRAARLFICNETFWAHLASALRTPTVALWGLGHWTRFSPRLGRMQVLRMDMVCRDCEWSCCFPQRRCILDIPVESLLTATQAQLRAPGDSIDIISHPSQISFAEIRAALRQQVRSAYISREEETTHLYHTNDALKNERNLLQAQLADLQHNFDAVEQDRLARGQVIEQQGQRASELERLVWLTEQNRDYWKNVAEKQPERPA